MQTVSEYWSRVNTEQRWIAPSIVEHCRPRVMVGRRPWPRRVGKEGSPDCPRWLANPRPGDDDGDMGVAMARACDLVSRDESPVVRFPAPPRAGSMEALVGADEVVPSLGVLVDEEPNH